MSLPNPPYHQIKSCYFFETKIFLERYTEIYRHLLSKCFKKVVLGRQEMVQCKWSFWHQTEACLQEKFVNWESFLSVFWKHFIFNFKRVEIRKISVAVLSETVLSNEWSFSLVFIDFEIFCYKFWSKKTLMMFIGTCGLKLYARKNILRKRNYKHEILNHLYFGPSFVFWRAVLRRFSQCFFSNFFSLVKHGDRHFYSAFLPLPP